MPNWTLYSPIMDMSIPYAETGRTGQKARTREAMVAATREWLAEGVTPTVEQAAERAASRARPRTATSPTSAS